jgi:tetratricopeptide repeat protein
MGGSFSSRESDATTVPGQEFFEFGVVQLVCPPYMRARLGLAHSLWTAGRRDEAVQHLQDMLRLNPGDNQGVRYTLSEKSSRPRQTRA